MGSWTYCHTNTYSPCRPFQTLNMSLSVDVLTTSHVVTLLSYINYKSTMPSLQLQVMLMTWVQNIKVNLILDSYNSFYSIKCQAHPRCQGLIFVHYNPGLLQFLNPSCSGVLILTNTVHYKTVIRLKLQIVKCRECVTPHSPTMD